MNKGTMLERCKRFQEQQNCSGLFIYFSNSMPLNYTLLLNTNLPEENVSRGLNINHFMRNCSVEDR